MSEHFTPITVHLGFSRQLAGVRLGLSLLSLVSVGRLWSAGGHSAWVALGLGVGWVGWLWWRSKFSTSSKQPGGGDGGIELAPDALKWLDPELIVPYRQGRALAPWRLERVTYLDRNFVVLRCRRFRELALTSGHEMGILGSSLPVFGRRQMVRHWVLATDAIGATTAHQIRRALRQWGPRTDLSEG